MSPLGILQMIWFGVERSRLGLTATWCGFELYECLLAVVKVARSSREWVAHGTEAGRRRWGWGIWHILCTKYHFFINSRGLKPEQGGRAPPPFNHCLLVKLGYNVTVQRTQPNLYQRDCHVYQLGACLGVHAPKYRAPKIYVEGKVE